MKKRLLLLLVVSLILPGRLGANTRYILETNDYSIYSVLIDRWYGSKASKRPVIRAYTGSCASLGLIKEELKYLAKEIPHLAHETAVDFRAKNYASYPLKSFIIQRAEYDFIDEETAAGIFRWSDGWKKFYKRYPHSEGILTFSRIGFNSKRNQALASVCGQWDDSTGAGIYILFAKQANGLWVPEYELRTWNSWIIEEDEEPSK